MTEQISIDHILGVNTEYDAFTEKFKPKLTTDDCYTPQLVYDAVADWTASTYGLDRSCFVRPFFPGGDYENYHYPPGCVVVDNPPFSIIQEIIRTYCKRGIRFLVFAPGLSGLAKGVEDRPATILAAGATIVYENGASVCTSFATNLETEYIVRSCPDLCKAVEKASAEARADRVKRVPKYKYPGHVLTLAQVNYYSAHDTVFGVRRGEAKCISQLDDQRAYGKRIFGGGLLISDFAAAEKAAAEKAAAEKAAAEKAAAEKAAAEKAAEIEWRLSEREREIIQNLQR